jgi:hypothetical protein
LATTDKEEAMSEREGPWPADGDLRELVREASEHRRVWAVVGGLSQTLLRERKTERPKARVEQNERIQHLEERIVKQKRAFTHLEECRAFEKETEQILSDALKLVCSPRNKDKETWLIAKNALDILKKRKGPRPQEADAS